jgi:hypothetical protein
MRICLLALLPGCVIVTVPQQAPVGPYVPVAREGETAGSAFADVVLWPSAGGSIQLPAGSTHIEFGGQVQPVGYAATAALWMHKNDIGDTREAHRFGLAGGFGDLLGVYPAQMPFVGGSYHWQVAQRRPKHEFATTLGFSILTPIGGNRDLSLGGTDIESAVIVTWPCAWFNARWAWAWPIRNTGDDFVLSAGFDIEAGLVAVSILATPIVPAPALGLSYRFGGVEYAPPSWYQPETQ